MIGEDYFTSMLNSFSIGGHERDRPMVERVILVHVRKVWRAFSAVIGDVQNQSWNEREDVIDTVCTSCFTNMFCKLHYFEGVISFISIDKIHRNHTLDVGVSCLEGEFFLFKKVVVYYGLWVRFLLCAREAMGAPSMLSLKHRAVALVRMFPTLDLS